MRIAGTGLEYPQRPPLPSFGIGLLSDWHYITCTCIMTCTHALSHMYIVWQVYVNDRQQEQQNCMREPLNAGVEAIGITRVGRSIEEQFPLGSLSTLLLQSDSALCSLLHKLRSYSLLATLSTIFGNAKIFSTFTYYNPRHHVNFLLPHRSSRRRHRHNWAPRRFPATSEESQRTSHCSVQGSPSIIPR